MKIKVLLLVLAVLSFTSCRVAYRVGYRSDLYTYIGYNYGDIVERFGQPTREYDEADGYVLVYEGTTEIFTYSYAHSKNYGVPIAKFLMGNDEICHDITLYNSEPVLVPKSGGLISYIILLFFFL